MNVHVVNVGHGDCIVVEFSSGRTTVVDINRSSEMDEGSQKEVLGGLDPYRVMAAGLMRSKYAWSQGLFLKNAGYDVELTDPVPYIKAVLARQGQSGLFRFISTHPHMDHLTGLCALRDQVGFANAWVLQNNFAQDYAKLSDEQVKDWELYKQLRADSAPNVRVVRPGEGSQGDFWQQDGICILAPSPDMLVQPSNPNDISYVLLIKDGRTKVVLGGDAEQATWDHIVEHYSEAIRNVTLLKASHHGRDSGYHQEAVKLMSPRWTAVSVGSKPESDATNKYRQYSANVVSTRWCGNLVFQMDALGNCACCAQYERASVA